MNEFMFALAGIFDMLVVVIYFNAVLERRHTKWIYLAIPFLSVFSCLGSYYLTIYSYQSWVVIWSIVMLLLLSFIYKGGLLSRLFHVIFTQVLAMVSELVSILFTHISLFGEDMGDVEKESVELVISKLFFFLLILAVLLFRKKRKSIPRKYLCLFSLVPLLSILVVYGLADGHGVAWGFSLLAILALNLIVYYLMYLLADFSTRQAREEMLQKQIEMQRENYEQLSQSFKQSNRLFHDVNKHLRQIGEYLNEKNWEEASRYLTHMEGTMQKSYNVVNCGNLVMDSIISNLKYQVESVGGTFYLELHIDASQIKIADYDLVTILGNVADNVVEEVRFVEASEVYASLETTENEFLIHIKNPIARDKKRKKRKDHWFHGLGLQNVKEAVEMYGGISSFEVKQGYFETMIMIPNNEE